LSTKVGRLLRPVPTGTVPDYSYVNPLSFDADYDYSYDGIMRSVEFSYARLGLNRIDILFVHDIGTYTHGVEKTKVHFRQLMDGGLKALEELKSSGVISAYGLGVNEVQICLDVLREAPLDCILLASRYSLLDRSAEAELLPLCRQRQTSLIIGGVFNSGILATGVRAGSVARFDYAPAARDWIERTAAIEAICEAFGVPLRAAALQFPLAHPAIDIVMVGAHSADQWRDSVAMMERPIPASFWHALRDHGLVPPEVPLPA